MSWNILIATENRAPFEEAMADAVQAGRIQVAWTADGKTTIEAVRRRRPDLLIVDARIDGRDGLALCRDVLRVDAFANMAAVSDLDEDDFHEASEGLGLIGRLPSQPGPRDFDKLLELLATLGGPVPVKPS